jgi:hypothetical protein
MLTDIPGGIWYRQKLNGIPIFVVSDALFECIFPQISVDRFEVNRISKRSMEKGEFSVH